MRIQREARVTLPAWWNVVICSGLVVITAYVGFTKTPWVFAATALGIVMLVVFIRKLRGEVRLSRARREPNV